MKEVNTKEKRELKRSYAGNYPDRLLRDLKVVAYKNNRSLNGQIIYVLEEFVKNYKEVENG